jgi:hypothetical protein
LWDVEIYGYAKYWESARRRLTGLEKTFSYQLSSIILGFRTLKGVCPSWFFICIRVQTGTAPSSPNIIKYFLLLNELLLQISKVKIKG